MIEAGTLLQNRYRVGKQIGQGGMGAVFLATDERFGSVVAIKETLFLDEKYRKAFEREARLLNSLKHPALPRVSDHFAEGNGQFLVMEYIEGDDLSEIMDRDRKAFALKDVLNWTDQLLDALEYLHAQEMPVIHRDIKPQNLKLTPRGQIILLDFGLAKGNVTNPESATAAKSMFGYSRNYASLEQIQGTGTDPRSDLYSLSATIYHLLTGVPPADALTRAMNVLSDKPDPLIPVHEVTPEIPESVSEVLYKVMALNAEQRPNSAKKMREMLLEGGKVASANVITKAENLKTPIATNIFTQETQIPVTAKQSEIHTELIGENPSKVTILKPFVTANSAANFTPTTQTKPSRRSLAIGATALGSLLLAGSAFSALYIYKPDIFGTNSNPENTPTENTSTVVNVATPNENVDVPEANINYDWIFTEGVNNSNSVPQKQETTKTETKEAETPKPETKPTKTQTTVTEDEDEDVTVSEDTDESPTPKPRPNLPNIKVFPNRFPRFPQERGNVNPQPNPQPNPQQRRRRQRQTNPY